MPSKARLLFCSCSFTMLSCLVRVSHRASNLCTSRVCTSARTVSGGLGFSFSFLLLPVLLRFWSEIHRKHGMFEIMCTHNLVHCYLKHLFEWNLILHNLNINCNVSFHIFIHTDKFFSHHSHIFCFMIDVRSYQNSQKSLLLIIQR